MLTDYEHMRHFEMVNENGCYIRAHGSNGDRSPHMIPVSEKDNGKKERDVLSKLRRIYIDSDNEQSPFTHTNLEHDLLPAHTQPEYESAPYTPTTPIHELPSALTKLKYKPLPDIVQEHVTQPYVHI